MAPSHPTTSAGVARWPAARRWSRSRWRTMASASIRSASLDPAGGYAWLAPGAVAEWLRSGLQSRVHEFDSRRRLAQLLVRLGPQARRLAHLPVAVHLPHRRGARAAVLRERRPGSDGRR